VSKDSLWWAVWRRSKDATQNGILLGEAGSARLMRWQEYGYSRVRPTTLIGSLVPAALYTRTPFHVFEARGNAGERQLVEIE
jgi:hypothetical protein